MTFWRCLLTGIGLPLLLGVAACAPTSPPATSATQATQSASAESGTIQSVRTVTASDDKAAWRTSFISDTGASGASADAKQGPLTEFIVRTDSGATISVVQNNELGLRAGDRVGILHDTRTHLVRPAGA